jgi:hypothetical protein
VNIIDLFLIAATFGAIACAVYWHGRWTNAIDAEKRAARKIAELEGKIVNLSIVNTNSQWRIDRRGPL